MMSVTTIIPAGPGWLALDECCLGTDDAIDKMSGFPVIAWMISYGVEEGEPSVFSITPITPILDSGTTALLRPDGAVIPLDGGTFADGETYLRYKRELRRASVESRALVERHRKK